MLERCLWYISLSTAAFLLALLTVMKNHCCHFYLFSIMKFAEFICLLHWPSADQTAESNQCTMLENKKSEISFIELCSAYADDVNWSFLVVKKQKHLQPKVNKRNFIFPIIRYCHMFPSFNTLCKIRLGRLCKTLRTRADWQWLADYLVVSPKRLLWISLTFCVIFTYCESRRASSLPTRNI